MRGLLRVFLAGFSPVTRFAAVIDVEARPLKDDARRPDDPVDFAFTFRALRQRRVME